MKNFSKWLVAVCGIGLACAGCSPEKTAGEAKADYVGIWKVTDSAGQVYYMTLNPDGTGQTTREGGESGKWHVDHDYIEAEWMGKTLKFYFDSGQTRPLAEAPGGGKNNMGPATAVKVEKIPGEAPAGSGP